METETTYKIERHFENGEREVIKTGLTREEAREHCQDPETNSRTATSVEAAELALKRGRWFDGFEEE